MITNQEKIVEGEWLQKTSSVIEFRNHEARLIDRLMDVFWRVKFDKNDTNLLLLITEFQR